MTIFFGFWGASGTCWRKVGVTNASDNAGAKLGHGMAEWQIREGVQHGETMVNKWDTLW